MKKSLFLVLLLLITTSLFSVSISYKAQEREFDSVPMLREHYSEDDEVSDFWDSVQISLLTFSKEDELYSWFGHTGLMVEIPNIEPVLYDYGRFAFSKDFYLNFAKGQLWYGCAGTYARYDLNDARANGRTVSQVVLNLTASQKKAVYEFLETNSTEPFNKYLYHHYNDNCSTRIRDIINEVTGGDFENWAKEQQGYTFRQQTSRILHHNVPLEWLLDLLQGPSIDTPATLWEEMFLPENLEKALLSYGKLTKETGFLTDFRDTDTRPVNYELPQSYLVFAIITGLFLGFVTFILGKNYKTAYIIETSIINFVLAVTGTLLFYMMFFSGHSFSWNNENIVYVNFMLFIPFAFTFRVCRNAKKLQITYFVASLVMCILIIAKLLMPSLMHQANWPQILTILPYYVANFAVFSRNIGNLPKYLK